MMGGRVIKLIQAAVRGGGLGVNYRGRGKVGRPEAMRASA